MAWQAQVYHKPARRHEFSADLRRLIRARDKNRCQVCKCKDYLSIHHIIPRDEGGTDDEDNLILLCDACHDEVEIAGYRLRAQILLHVPAWVCERFPMAVEQEPLDPNDWRTWVYGGYRGPR